MSKRTDNEIDDALVAVAKHALAMFSIKEEHKELFMSEEDMPKEEKEEN